MAVLPDVDRIRVWRGLMRHRPFGGIAGIVKTDLRAAVNAADVWIDSNTAGFVAALPDPFRTNSSQNQKLLLFVAVLLMRFGLDLLKALFGEVD